MDAAQADATVTANGREALIDWGKGLRRAAIGRGGIGSKQREGDGITPIGIWPVRKVMFRGDRVYAPRTRLKLWPIISGDAWCDAPDDARYNRWVRTPYPASHEMLWREDRLYDIAAVLGFNDAPVIPGRGSAIFLHVARPDYGPTEGCIALAQDDLLELLATLAPGAAIAVRTI
jgi:L,D-peptidoglycan transpeptidase YkuD (ErfK/YbiS/YcfS/YnhG family)